MFSDEGLWGQFEAWLAEGSKDAHNALKAFPDSLQGVDQLGTPLNMPSQIVTEELKGYEAELNRAASLGADQGPEMGLGL